MKKRSTFRPHLDDVERLSYGKGAVKQRGTGNRNVCHRLNQEERTIYEKAKESGILVVRGTGYRKERKGSPLHNIFRQRCDALAQLCIIVEKRTSEDTVVIDFSTLRVPDDSLYIRYVLLELLEPKYPSLYQELVKEQSNDDVTSLINRDQRGVRRGIQWNIVKSEPIWAVPERVLSIACEREVAKALAQDIYEAAKVHFDHEMEAEAASNELDERKDEIQGQGDEIDWNDI